MNKLIISPRYWALFLVLAILIPLTVVNAGTRAGLSLSMDCEGFASEGGSILLDRDNTGLKQEAITITGMDSAGNIVFGPMTSFFFVGGTMTLPEGTFFEWTAAPTLNPIVVTIYSDAGNDLEAELVYAAMGTCAGLPTLAAETDEVLDGSTSPSVDLNEYPPEGINPEGIGATHDGYLIVNTPRLNIRSGDGPEYTIVGRTSGGQELIVLGINEAGSWWYIEIGELRGWVINDFVAKRGDLRDTPVVPVMGEILPPRFVTYSPTMLYATSHLTGTVLCELPGNTEFVIIGQGRGATSSALVAGGSTGPAALALEATCGDEIVDGWVSPEKGAIRNDGGLSIPVIN